MAAAADDKRKVPDMSLLQTGPHDPQLREGTLVPFWFWNDALDEQELLRQIDDFQRHGVHGFVIHPRVGLPRSLGWMSDALLHFYDVAITAAAQRGMIVFLYDDGMYPSGSASGQVVEANPLYACRGLAKITCIGRQTPVLPQGWNEVARFHPRDGNDFVVVDRPVGATMRGLHFLDPDPPRHPGPDSNSPGSPRPDPDEDEPAAADLLNPDAVACFIRLVYDRFFTQFKRHFGRTVQAIFTDEPGVLGRGAPAGCVPGTTGMLAHVSRILGYDFTPHLPALWDANIPDAAVRRADYHRAVQARLEETYYRPLHDWCEAHGVALTGHPERSDQIGVLRHFQMPGQDLVWRYVEPGKPSALEGEHATMAKCSSSAMIHGGRRRNANEFCGAYGHRLTFEEMQWLAHWCLIRGVNLLLPHAFYYSVRGPRMDERPPDVGPHSAWWNTRFTDFAENTARLCLLNTDSTHVCDIAILGASNRLPWRAAKICFQHQRDFNYLDLSHLADGSACVDADGIRIAGMHYRVLVVEPETVVPPEVTAILAPLDRPGRIVAFDGQEATLLSRLDAWAPPWLHVAPPQPDLRVRRVVKDGRTADMLFNEGLTPLHAQVDCGAGPRLLELASGELAVWSD